MKPEMERDDGRLVTTKELARRWGCSQRHVYNLLDHHGLPSVRLGPRARRIRLADAEAWLEAQQAA